MTRLLHARETELRLSVEKSELSLLVDAMAHGAASKTLPLLADQLHRDVGALRAQYRKNLFTQLAADLGVPATHGTAIQKNLTAGGIVPPGGNKNQAANRGRERQTKGNDLCR
jgi:hypothetical protein